jgi:hypothetical protein
MKELDRRDRQSDEIETNCRIEIRIEHETTREVTSKAKAENEISTNHLFLLLSLENRILFFSFFFLFFSLYRRSMKITQSLILFTRLVIDRSFEGLNHSYH